MNPYTIYGLRLIGSKEVRYIGQTRSHLEVRMAGHFSKKRDETETPLRQWLVENRQQIECFKIGYADDPDEARAIESVFISLCSRLDHRLFNRKSGRKPNKAKTFEGMAA